MPQCPIAGDATAFWGRTAYPKAPQLSGSQTSPFRPVCIGRIFSDIPVTETKTITEIVAFSKY